MYNRSELSKAIKQAKASKSKKKPVDVDVDLKGKGYKDPKNSNKPALKLYTDSIYNPTDKDLMLYPDNGLPVFKPAGDVSTTFFPGANNVTERVVAQRGGYVSKQITHFQDGGNTDPGNNALELHMFYDKDVYQDGGEYLDLTDQEIEEYRKGGYVVEERPQAQDMFDFTFIDPSNPPTSKITTPSFNRMEPTPEQKERISQLQRNDYWKNANYNNLLFYKSNEGFVNSPEFIDFVRNSRIDRGGNNNLQNISAEVADIRSRLKKGWAYDPSIGEQYRMPPEVENIFNEPPTLSLRKPELLQTFKPEPNIQANKQRLIKRYNPNTNTWELAEVALNSASAKDYDEREEWRLKNKQTRPSSHMITDEEKQKYEKDKQKQLDILAQFQDGGLTQAQRGIIISDPKEYEYRKGMYDDSLSLYNAYQFQKKNTNPIPKVQKYVDDYNRTSKLYPEIRRPGEPKTITVEDMMKKRSVNFNKNLPKFGHREYLDTKKNPSGGFDPMDRPSGDYKIYDYNEKLKFNYPVALGKHSSPDIWHSRIKPSGSYFDGVAYSPKYKKPVQPVYNKQDNSIPATLPISAEPAVETPVDEIYSLPTRSTQTINTERSLPEIPTNEETLLKRWSPEQNKWILNEVSATDPAVKLYQEKVDWAKKNPQRRESSLFISAEEQAEYENKKKRELDMLQNFLGNKTNENLAKAQKGGQRPILYVDPNDPAGREKYQAYQDSLSLHNLHKGHIESLQNTPNTASGFDSWTTRVYNPVFWESQELKNRLYNLNNEFPEPENIYQHPSARIAGGWRSAEEYKKPLQQVKYKPNPEIGNLPTKKLTQVETPEIIPSNYTYTPQEPETIRTASRSQTVMEPDPNRPGKFRMKELRQVPYSAYFPGEGWEDMGTPRVVYYNPETDQEGVERFQNGGLTKAQKGGQYYTYSDSKGVYRKVGDKWEVDWNRSGNFQPLSKGNVKQREAALNKGAKQFFDQDYSALVDNRNQAFESAPAKPVAKKITPEQRVAQKQFDQSFQVTDKSNYEQIENEAKKVIDQSKAFAKEKGLEFTKADEDRVVRDMFAYSGVYDPIRGSIERPVIDMPSDSSVSFEAPKNPTVGDYAGRAWDIIRNPIDAFNYSVKTGDVSNMPWNYSAYEDAKSSTGYRDFTDDNTVGSALNVASYFLPAGAIMHGIADMVELPGRAYKNIQEGNWGDLAADVAFTGLEFIPGLGLIDDIAQGARRLELNRLRNIPIPNREPRVPGYITTNEQYQQYQDYLASSAESIQNAGRSVGSLVERAPSTRPTFTAQQRQNAELLSEWITNRNMPAEQLRDFVQRSPDWARLVDDYAAVTGNSQEINAFLSGMGSAPSRYINPPIYTQADNLQASSGIIDLRRPATQVRDGVVTWDNNTFTRTNFDGFKTKKGPLKTIQTALIDLDKKIGSFIEEKFGELKKPISITDIEKEVNTLLEKGVGVKKGDFKIRIAANPNGNNAAIHLDIKDYLTKNKELLEKTYPGTDIDAWLKTVPDGFVNSGNINIPSTLNPNIKNRTFTEILSGKPKQTTYLHSGASSPIETPGLRKKGEFPFENWDSALKTNVLNNLGVSGEYNKAINEALKSRGYGLYSGGTGHLSDGAKRYVKEFLNNRVDIVNPERAQTFLEKLNDTETMRLVNEAFKNKDQRLPDELQDAIQNVIFKYKKKGGNYQQGGSVGMEMDLTDEEIKKYRDAGYVIIE
jgi:hypothetical protein